jgi:capsular polysaccharide biosynthesis protein
MQGSQDAFRYIGYLGKRWRFVALSSALAALLALGVSAALPARYTATAQIVIEPPAGTDLRAAMAVSPIYLESLRTYEHFADSQTLFQKALNKFHLRERLGSGSLESLKRRILRTEIVRNTRILEVSATLPDPHDAHAMAEYVAEETVSRSRSIAEEGDRDLIAGFEREVRDAKAHMDESEEAWKRLAAAEPVEGLQTEIQNLTAMRQKITEFIFSTELEIADSAHGPAGEIDAWLKCGARRARSTARSRRSSPLLPACRRGATRCRPSARPPWTAGCPHNRSCTTRATKPVTGEKGSES